MKISRNTAEMTRGVLFPTEVPKIAFAASLGGNGLVKTTSGNKDLIYREVLTNVGGAYNAATGERQWLSFHLNTEQMKLNAVGLWVDELLEETAGAVKDEKRR